MNLKKKKILASKALNAGTNRIVFDKDRLSEIKEAITKQDIKDLFSQGIISIKPIKGRKKIEKRKNRRGPGKIKKKIRRRKQDYVKITRKLRKLLNELKKQGKINDKKYKELRKQIKNKAFRSRVHFNEAIK